MTSTAAPHRRPRTAAARAQAQRRQRSARHRRTFAYAAAALVVVVAATLGILLGRGGGGGTPTTAAAVPTGATEQGGYLVGSPSAPVHLVAYEDPQCPVCGDFERTNGPALKAAVDAGKVSVEYRMRSFLGTESVRADNALAAAQAEGKFEALREAVYAHQPEEHTGGFTTADLLSLGRSVGLTAPAYITAVQSMSYADFVRATDDRASRDGNVGTPELRKGGTPLTQQQVFDPAAFAAAIASS